jgi:hypothetical protein
MTSLARFNRQEFLATRFNYQPGEHVFICQPSQGGKTHFAFQLLNSVPHVKPPATMVMKVKDPTPARMTKKYGWKEVDHWPPPTVMPWSRKPRGYTLWPKHSLSLDPASLEKTDGHLKRQFEMCLMDAYKNGNRVVFVDEVYSLLAELKMHRTILAMVNRGSSAGGGLWYATQRPAGTQTGGGLPGPLFNMPTHLFLGFDPVEANRKTFSQIGGINTRLVMDEVSGLQVYPIETPNGTRPISDLLYINKNGPRGGYLCIVSPW